MNPYDNYEDPYGPDNDFYRKWKRDESGRDCLVGLNFEESQEYETLSMNWLRDRTIPNQKRPTREEQERDSQRWDELYMRHETARLARLSDPDDRKQRLVEFQKRASGTPHSN